MAFLFGGRGRSKSPAEIARSLKDLLQKLKESPGPKVEEDVAKHMAQMKLIVQGTPEVDTSPESVHNLISTIINEDLLYTLVTSLPLLPFEARKDLQIIFSHILRFRPPASPQSADPAAISYLVLQRPEIIVALCRGYSDSKSAMPCGTILRQALAYDTIAAVILYDETTKEGEKAVRLGDVDVTHKASGKGVFWEFFSWINDSSFEVSADAFTTFREILTKHKPLVAQYLTTNYTAFFTTFNDTLLLSTSYVTKRQSIKLLGELLLDRANYTIMTAYVASAAHLKLTMTLLRDDRKMVQYEAFHVFKVFVANPNKSDEVKRILVRNRGRLLKFLPSFLDGRTEDDQFLDEKSFLVRQIELLPETVEELDRLEAGKDSSGGGGTGGQVPVSA